jgi:hypothetical protein
MLKICSKEVLQIRRSSPEMDTAKVLNALLDNETWLAEVKKCTYKNSIKLILKTKVMRRFA